MAVVAFPAMVEIFNSLRTVQNNMIRSILYDNLDITLLESRSQNQGDALSSYRLALIKEYNLLGNKQQLSDQDIEELKNLYRSAVSGHIAGAHYRLGRLMLNQASSITEIQEIALYYLYYQQQWGGLLHQLVRQVRTDNLPTIFKNAKGGDADAIYQIATHLKYSSSTRDKSSELFALCAEMESGGCNFEYGKLVADGRVKVINGVNGDAYIIQAISIYEEEYNKNPTAMLALKIADCYNYLSTQYSFQTRKQALRYYQLGAEGKVREQ